MDFRTCSFSHQEDDAPVEYIKRDSALKYIALSYAMTDLDTDRMTCHALFQMIKSEPAADVALVRHGRWIIGATMHHDWMKCSECLVSQDLNGCFSYCPNCGAKMDKEAGNG